MTEAEEDGAEVKNHGNLQGDKVRLRRGLLNWIPACAGMTVEEAETG